MKFYADPIQIALPLRLSSGTYCFERSSTFETEGEIQWCYHSNETSSAVLSHGAI